MTLIVIPGMSNAQIFTSKEIPSSREVLITPSQNSSASDFDFLVGKWKIHNRKLRSRLSHSNDWFEFESTQEMQKILMGTGNADYFKATLDGKPFEGMTLRLFDPATRLWSIYWADSNTGRLDKPVVGSFENKIGRFYSSDEIKGKQILWQFEWDATDAEQPVWRQAISTDNGRTWEWNWYMYFTRMPDERAHNRGRKIEVLELRNYITRPGQRDNFIDYFETNLTEPQNAIGGYTLGQFRIADEDDHFFWIRGFASMATRSKFLPEFYFGPVWKQHRSAANSMLANNDNVHLLTPVAMNRDQTEFDGSEFGRAGGITVIDYYTSNTKRDKLISFFKSRYIPAMRAAGISTTSLWMSEPTPSDFPALPVFQDGNLLVSITCFSDEFEYRSKLRVLESGLNNEDKVELRDLVTTKNTLILHPTKRSFSIAEEKHE